jgi:transcription initiation factor TFIIIB Brf1 subunit/transcription initiation factor TFIIB
VCRKCGGDYIVGEGGRLECNKCGHVIGDISLLFGKRPFEDINQYQLFAERVSEEYPSKIPKDSLEMV